MSTELLRRIAEAYDRERGFFGIEDLIGFGNDGHVWRRTDQEMGDSRAIKVFEREASYLREKACYKRLREKNVYGVGEFVVPKILCWDDYLCAIEMSVVEPPFLLDFGKSYLDENPPYFDDPEIMDEYWRKHEEQFTPEQWKMVLRAHAELENMGIWHTDPNPRNFQFKT